METEKLHQVLEQLHEELGRAERLDPESLRLLEELMSDISKVLGAPGDGEKPAEPAGLAERLAEISKDFEDHHPTLVTAIGRLADALSRIGV